MQKGFLFLLLCNALLFSTEMKAQENLFPSSIIAVTIRLKPGDDVKQKLEELAKTMNIKAGCVLSCAGSLDKASIRFANQPNADTLMGKFEIVSLSGTIAVSGCHLHIAVSDSLGKTIGGHVKEGCIVYTTAEIVVGIFPDVKYKRETDSNFGYKELVIEKND